MSFLLGWLWAVISWVVGAVAALTAIAMTALFWTEAVSRSWKLAQWGVVLQVRRLHDSERGHYSELWRQSIARCEESGYPIEALYRAFVIIPHDCRCLLRKRARAELDSSGAWSPWTRSGILVFQVLTRLINAFEESQARVSLVSVDGRISWAGLASFDMLFPRLNLGEIARHPSIVRASLMTEADAVYAELLAASDQGERDRLVDAYDNIIAALKGRSAAAPTSFLCDSSNLDVGSKTSFFADLRARSARHHLQGWRGEAEFLSG